MLRRRGPGLLATMARTAVVAGTATAVSGGLARRQQAQAQQATEAQEFEEAHQAQRYAQQEPPAPAADPVSTLKELADLKAAGALTDEEFALAKAKFLSM